MAQEFTLYYFPSSFYSLKVYYALQEKGVPLKERIVNMVTNEQIQDWFLQINPRGEVPVLQHGDKFIPDSEAIIDYIEEYYPQGSTLVPTVETSLGEDVNELRQMLHSVPIDHITFGVLVNRNFRTSEPRFPKLIAKFAGGSRAVKGLRDRVDTMQVIKSKLSGDNQEILLSKIRESEERLEIVLNQDKVSAILDDLERVFDTLEGHLEKSKKVAGVKDDIWLLGNTITVVDVIAATIMYRLYLIGIDERYFSDTKRRIVKDYFDRLRERPALQNTIKLSESVWKYIVKAILWNVSKIGVIAGVVILGVVAARAGYKNMASSD